MCSYNLESKELPIHHLLCCVKSGPAQHRVNAVSLKQHCKCSVDVLLFMVQTTTPGTSCTSTGASQQSRQLGGTVHYRKRAKVNETSSQPARSKHKCHPNHLFYRTADAGKQRYVLCSNSEDLVLGQKSHVYPTTAQESLIR